MTNVWRVFGRACGIAWALSLAAPPPAQAHRLDEYLQAVRVGVETNAVFLELDLTPGIETAPKLISILDLNRDGAIASDEGAAYADRVRSDLRLRVDGRRVVPGASVEVLPTVAELRSGAGVIRLRLDAGLAPWRPGRHRVELENRHAPVTSVYLANALHPSSSQIIVVQQKRDPDQRKFRVDFDVPTAR